MQRSNRLAIDRGENFGNNGNDVLPSVDSVDGAPGPHMTRREACCPRRRPGAQLSLLPRSHSWLVDKRGFGSASGWFGHVERTCFAFGSDTRFLSPKHRKHMVSCGKARGVVAWSWEWVVVVMAAVVVLRPT